MDTFFKLTSAMECLYLLLLLIYFHFEFEMWLSWNSRWSHFSPFRFQINNFDWKKIWIILSFSLLVSFVLLANLPCFEDTRKKVLAIAKTYTCRRKGFFSWHFILATMTSIDERQHSWKRSRWKNVGMSAMHIYTEKNEPFCMLKCDSKYKHSSSHLNYTMD